MSKSLLNDLCQERRWASPRYVCRREGPGHALRFQATVDVNGDTFTSPDWSSTVKRAKGLAAEAAMEHLSAIPRSGNPFSTTHDAAQSSNVHGQEVSASSGQKGDEPVRKRKHSQIAQVLEELTEPKQTEQFTIGNCVAALETMEDLSREEKSKCLRLFKCPGNREIFLNTKDSILQTLWLKNEISAMEKA